MLLRCARIPTNLISTWATNPNGYCLTCCRKGHTDVCPVAFRHFLVVISVAEIYRFYNNAISDEMMIKLVMTHSVL